MKQKTDILALRVLKILPEDAWSSASALTKAYEKKFHSEISTAKMASVLQFLYENGLIQRRSRRRRWGLISVYTSADLEAGEN